MDTETQTDNIAHEGSIDPKILKRIRGLFASAESFAGTPAAESYEDKAMELLAQYGIAERVARVRDTTHEKKMTRKIIKISGAYLPQRRSLLSDLGRVYGVYVTWNVAEDDWQAYKDAFQAWALGGHRGKQPTRPPKNAMRLHGYDTDIERTELLFTLLVAQSYAALKKVTAADIPWWYDGGIRSWRQSFFEGWVDRVAERVRQMEEKEIEEVSNSTALVLANPLDQAKKLAEELAGKKAKPQKRSVRSSTAYHQGRAEGDYANIGQTGVGSHKKALAG